MTCPTNLIDLVFVVDSSYRTDGATTWQYKLSFVNNIVDGFQIGSNSVRVGFVRYASTADVLIQLNTYTNRSSLESAIAGLGYDGRANGDLSGALGSARTMFANSGRSSAAHVLVLIVDTSPANTYQTLLSTMTGVQSDGVRMVSVGVTFESGQLDSNTQQLLSYYYPINIVNLHSNLVGITNQTVVRACPLVGMFNSMIVQAVWVKIRL